MADGSGLRPIKNRVRRRPTILCSSTAAAVETMNSLMVPIAPVLASRASNMWLARNSHYWSKRSTNRIAKPRRPYLHCNTRDRNDRGPHGRLLGYQGISPYSNWELSSFDQFGGTFTGSFFRLLDDQFWF